MEKVQQLHKRTKADKTDGPLYTSIDVLLF